MWAQVAKWILDYKTLAKGYTRDGILNDDDLKDWIDTIKKGERGIWTAMVGSTALHFYTNDTDLLGVQAFTSWGREGWTKEYQWAKRGYKMSDLEKVDTLTAHCIKAGDFSRIGDR